MISVQCLADIEVGRTKTDVWLKIKEKVWYQ